MSKRLPPRPHLDLLKKQAKALLKAHRAADPETIQRIRSHTSKWAQWSDTALLETNVTLQDAQHVIAGEYGFASWPKLVAAVAASDQDERIAIAPTDAQTLTTAIQDVDLETVKRILERSPGLANERAHSEDGTGDTLLGLAITQRHSAGVSDDHLAIVQAFVDAGADLEGMTDHGMFPLGVAAWLGRLPIVELLITAGADIDAEPEPTDTALSVAADHRHVEVVERLIQAGATYDARPLAQAGMVPHLTALLDADPDAVNRIVHLGHLNGVYGPPLLALVEDYGFEDAHLPEVAQLLIDRGADVGIPDSANRTALQQALAKRQSCEQNGVETRYCDAVIQLLIDHGAEVDLFAAIALGDAETVRRLLDENPTLGTTPRVPRPHSGESPDWDAALTTTPVQFAERFGRSEIIALLSSE